MKIDGIEINGVIDKATGQREVKKEKDGFAELLKKSLEEVNRLQNEANTSIKNVAAGKMDNIQDAVLAIEKADISLKLLTQIRNKAIEAYKEIMRMQV